MGAISGIINLKENMYIYSAYNKLLIKQMAEGLRYNDDTEIKECIGENFAFSYAKTRGSKNCDFMKRTVEGYEFSVIFDGELYNNNELKKELEKIGYDFTEGNDLEILLYTYIHFGKKFINMLNGVYAFCIWDSMRQEALICCDRMGIKPLFYIKSDDKIVFSSEPRALFNYPDIKPEIDKDGLLDFFAFMPYGYEGKTIFKNIRELESAHTISLNRFGATKNKYWDFDEFSSDDNEKEANENIKLLLKNSIHSRVRNEKSFYTIVDDNKLSLIVNLLAEKESITTGKLKLSYSFDSDILEKGDFSRHGIIEPFELGNIDFFNDLINFKDVMGDIYKSIYYLNGIDKIRKNNGVIITTIGMEDNVFSVMFGESGKEILPIYNDLSYQNQLLKPMVKKTLNINEYFNERNDQLLKNHSVKYLNLKRIIRNICDIQYTASRFSGHSLRNPILDYKVFEYLWWMSKKGYKNPLNMLYNRKLENKKNKYEPCYILMIQKRLEEIISNDNSYILAFMDRNEIKNVCLTGKENDNLKENMQTNQLIEQLIWFEGVLKRYNPKLI